MSTTGAERGWDPGRWIVRDFRAPGLGGLWKTEGDLRRRALERGAVFWLVLCTTLGTSKMVLMIH